jgi:hypothetical protein
MQADLSEITPNPRVHPLHDPITHVKLRALSVSLTRGRLQGGGEPRRVFEIKTETRNRGAGSEAAPELTIEHSARPQTCTRFLGARQLGGGNC